MRNRGYGTITITGIPAGSTVTAAYLLWDVLDFQYQPADSFGALDGQHFQGQFIGYGPTPCWPASYNYAFWTNVTPLVSGNGAYSLAGFASGATNATDPFLDGSPAPELEGASLVVFYSNPSMPNRTLELFTGSQESAGNSLSASLLGFSADASHAATTSFVVADGQTSGNSASFDGTSLGPAFAGSDPIVDGPLSQGSLWDTFTQDVPWLVHAGDTSASAGVTTGVDCVVWVGQVLGVSGTSSTLFPVSPSPDFVSASAVPAVTIEPVSATELNGPNALAQGLTVATAGEPVDVATGNFQATHKDLALPGLGVALSAGRTYNSDLAGTNGPFGYGWSGSYLDSLAINSSAGTITVNEANGSTALYDITSSGIAPAQRGVTATLVQNADGTYTLTSTAGIAEQFSSGGQLQSETDRNGYKTVLGYNAGGQLATVTDPEGRVLTYSWTGSHITGISDGEGRSVSFAYDASGNLASATDIDGHSTDYGYSASHQLTSITDPDGHTLSNTYDSSGRVLTQTDATGATTSFSYATGATTVTAPDGSQVQYQFNSDLLPTAVTRGFASAYAATTKYTYDSNDNVATITLPGGQQTTDTWDSSGNLLTSTDALGGLTVYSYNSFNEPTAKTDPLGVTTSYSYDAHGNLTGVSTPIGDGRDRVVVIGYDPTRPGVVSQITDPDGHTWTYQHDQYGQTTATIDPLGHKRTFAYNNYGQLVATVDPRGYDAGASPAAYTTSYSYTPSGLLTSVTDPDGNITKYSYDAAGLRSSMTDPNGNTTTYAYDGDGRLTSTKLPDGSVRSTTYTPSGLIASQTDGVGDSTSYAYNALELPASTTLPGGEQTSYGYDSNGWLTGLTDAQSQSTVYSYDADGRLTGITFQNTNTPNQTYTYDADGRLTAMSDGTGGGTFTYDNLGDLLSQTTGSGAGSETVGYSYDPAGLLTGITYPNGLLGVNSNLNGTTITTPSSITPGTVTRSYNADGQLSSVADWLGNKTTFAYDSAGNLTATSYPNGITDARTYDPAGRLTQITDTNAQGVKLLDLPYQYDPNGQITQTGLDLGTVPDTSQQYAYNSAGELTSASANTAGTATTQSSYSYDPAQRITATTLATAAPDSLSYNNDSELQKIVDQTTSTTLDQLSYDPNGNRTSETNPTTGANAKYEWDQAGRLIAYRGPAVNLINDQTGGNITQASYSYDAQNLRSDLIWDRAEGLPLIIGTTTATAGLPVAAYITGPDGLPIEQITAANQAVLYYQHDQLGSTRLLTNQSGQIVQHYTYTPYGNQTTPAATGITNPFQYAGQYLDPNTGLIYLRARYYDPTTGQFISQDPLEPITGTPYAYAGDNPITNSDPTGLGCGILDAFNPFSSCNIAYQAASYVYNNPVQTLGLVAGAASLATGVGAAADLGILSLDAGGSGVASVATGIGATIADGPACLSSSGGAVDPACLGFAAGAVGTVLGGGGLGLLGSSIQGSLDGPALALGGLALGGDGAIYLNGLLTNLGYGTACGGPQP